MWTFLACRPRAPESRLWDLRPVTFGIFAAVVFLIVTESSATASCGDWLDHSLLASEPEANSAGQSTPTPAENPVPCRGPSCRGVPTAPLPPAPAVPPNPTKDYGFRIGLQVAVLPLLLGQLVAETDTDAPTGHPARVDRPPRLS